MKINPIFKKINSLIYHYKRIKTKVGVKLIKSGKVEIKKPIFALGTDGGGLTLLSRILFRNKNIIYVGGNYNYWAGADNIFKVLDGMLPSKMSKKKLKTKGIIHPYDSLYATEDTLPYYRKDSKDFDIKTKKILENIIKKIIRLNRPKEIDSEIRFMDRSQVFSVQVGFLNKLLEEYNPKFVMLTRNPFAYSWRRLTKIKEKEAKEKVSSRDYLKMSAAHWNNNFSAALEDKSDADLEYWRFEDFLRKPEESLKEICNFLDLKFNKEVLPSKSDNIPLGSAYDVYTHKWYPLRPGVNKKYLKEIPKWAIDIVYNTCGELIDEFNYSHKIN